MKYIYNKIIGIFLAATLICLVSACSSHPSVPEQSAEADRQPYIFPDYRDVTIPPNIAPLNFSVKEGTENCVALFTYPGGTMTYGKGYKVQIPEDEWKEILTAAKGKSIKVTVYSESDGKWTKFKDFAINVAEEEIDPYISYRIISPSYVAYEMLSINERNLTNFDEDVIYNNMLLSTEDNGQCINCHSYQNYSTDNMQFHIRQGHGGTLIVHNGVPQKVDLKTSETVSAGVYPSWHPTLPIIAYSTNVTGQSFHTKSLEKVEVQDSESDIILYDIENNEVSTVSAEPNEFEVYPWWTPDGKTLYYVSAHFEFKDTLPDAELLENYKEVKYDIYKRSFNSADKTFGAKELVFSASSIGKSATLPRISPDGKYLLFSMGNNGCFHIWHPEADLYVTDLATMKTKKLEEANSNRAESYHSWSSNGRWILFSSRRDDSNYTRLYIAYFDKNGRGHKAFELPQKDPDFYTYYLRSYNIPEYMKEAVKITPQEFASAIKSDPVKANYVERRKNFKKTNSTDANSGASDVKTNRSIENLHTVN